MAKFNASPETEVLVLRITCAGAAFHEDDDTASPQLELAKILRAVADRLDGVPGYGSFFETLRDSNGNECGKVALKPAEYWRGEWPTA